MHLLENLKWRYATKIFETEKKVSKQDLDILKEAIQLTPTSYGLQPFKILIIKDLKIRIKLSTASYDQPQITTASHLFIFCNYTELPKNEIENYIQLTAKTQNISPKNLEGYKQLITNDIKQRNQKELQNWSKNQNYIAMSNLLNACAELKIDACPMEGFDNEAYNEILDLNKLQLNASIIVPIGYRAIHDNSQFREKVRKGFDQIFINK